MKTVRITKCLAILCICISFCMTAGCKEKEEIRGGAALGSYVSSACLYMNPLSSFLPLGGDSGEVYHIEDGQFLVTGKIGDYSEMIPVEEWKWQEFPYSDKEWLSKLILLNEDTKDLELTYQKMRYQKISNKYELMQMDGMLWLVSKATEEAKDIWSIYTLISEGSRGTAQWSPAKDEDSLTFWFDVACEEIAVFTTTGQVAEEDGQRGMNITLTKSTEVKWTGKASEVQISFYISDKDGKIIHSGNIYMIENGMDETNPSYKIQLACNTLMLEQDEETGEIRIY